MRFQIDYDLPDEIYIELGRIAATAGQIEYVLFGMFHDLLQSPLPGLAGAKKAAGSKTYRDTADLVEKQVRATVPKNHEIAAAWADWRREADEFMRRRNSLLHANWMVSETAGPIPVQRKNLAIESDFELKDLIATNEQARFIVRRGFVVSNMILTYLNPPSGESNL